MEKAQCLQQIRSIRIVDANEVFAERFGSVSVPTVMRRPIGASESSASLAAGGCWRYLTPNP
jgi:hypothetical protein